MSVTRSSWAILAVVLASHPMMAGEPGSPAARPVRETRLDHRRPAEILDDAGQPRPIRDLREWRQRRRQILEGMQAAMGRLPDRGRRPDLDIRVLATKRSGGVERRTLTYVAEAGDRVPADLYLPNGIARGERRPAMLALHPTGRLGKRIVAGEGPRANRQYALELAERGYVVLAPDYPSFGDYDYDFENDDYVSGTMKGVVNHMRAVDLLAGMERVDPKRIGVIGHSLGGHNAMFVGVFDERLKVVVSSCGWTPFHDYYGGKIAGWTSDRYMPRLRSVYDLDPDRVPFDFAEVVAALAPRPFFSSSPLRDANFDVAGVRKAVPEARKIYKLYGVPGALRVESPACEHDFPPDVRKAAYKFVDKALSHRSTR